MSDFIMAGSGTIYLLFAKTDAAIDWVAENLPADAQRLGDAIAIEARYIADIADGIRRSGLTINDGET